MLSSIVCITSRILTILYPFSAGYSRKGLFLPRLSRAGQSRAFVTVSIDSEEQRVLTLSLRMTRQRQEHMGQGMLFLRRFRLLLPDRHPSGHFRATLVDSPTTIAPIPHSQLLAQQ